MEKLTALLQISLIFLKIMSVIMDLGTFNKLFQARNQPAQIIPEAKFSVIRGSHLKKYIGFDMAKSRSRSIGTLNFSFFPNA